MTTGKDIFLKYKGKSRFTGSSYIDPMGYEFPLANVTCPDCMFSLGWDSCLIFKEQGLSDTAVRDKRGEVDIKSYCEYFLFKDFSEGDCEDENVRQLVIELATRMGFVPGGR